MPTLETESGEVIRDGAAIIDHYEALSGNQFSPKTPKQQILSRLFDVIGAEGMLRPAMHYRWNFPEENLALLKFHFQSAIPRGAGRAEKADKATNRMRAAGVGFGVVPETFSLVEDLYGEWLMRLNAHFADYPYLFGGKPSIGDFGMIAPLYGHLGRDPKPLALMQANGVQLYRWVERMNRPELDIGEFEDQSGDYLLDDEIPDTLTALLSSCSMAIFNSPLPNAIPGIGIAGMGISPINLLFLSLDPTPWITRSPTWIVLGSGVISAVLWAFIARLLHRSMIRTFMMTVRQLAGR